MMIMNPIRYVEGSPSSVPDVGIQVIEVATGEMAYGSFDTTVLDFVTYTATPGLWLVIPTWVHTGSNLWQPDKLWWEDTTTEINWRFDTGATGVTNKQYYSIEFVVEGLALYGINKKAFLRSVVKIKDLIV
jgi:hypothetical protein